MRPATPRYSSGSAEVCEGNATVHYAPSSEAETREGHVTDWVTSRELEAGEASSTEWGDNATFHIVTCGRNYPR